MNASIASLLLWSGQALYIGRGRASTRHRHYAMQIGMSLDQPFCIRQQETDRYERYHGFVVAPNVLHQIDADNVPSVFFWTESTNLAAHVMQDQANTFRPIATDHLNMLIPTLKQYWGQPLDCASAAEVCALIIQTIANPKHIEPPLDARIRMLLDIIRDQHISGDRSSIAHIARTVHLSPGRLRHLFLQQMGLSLQRYLVWQRLLCAIQIAANESLTEAAHEAGFADSAHLSRVFRATFGLTASAIFKNRSAVQVRVCPM